jgi:hypothetical protein
VTWVQAYRCRCRPPALGGGPPCAVTSPGPASPRRSVVPVRPWCRGVAGGDAGVRRVVEQPPDGGHDRREVRPRPAGQARSAREQRVAGEQVPGHRHGEAPGGVARRVQEPDLERPDPQDVPVLDRDVGPSRPAGLPRVRAQVVARGEQLTGRRCRRRAAACAGRARPSGQRSSGPASSAGPVAATHSQPARRHRVGRGSRCSRRFAVAPRATTPTTGRPVTGRGGARR